MNLNTQSMFNSYRQQLIKQRYNEIYKHELAHKSAAGDLGGPIIIEKDSNGIPFAGHVSIKMPTLSKSNPDKTIDHAKRVIRSAMAPSDPSAQDYRVAAQAKSIKDQAESLKHKKGLDYYA